MHENNQDHHNETEKADIYEQILLERYTDAEIAEIKSLMLNWDKATYPTLSHSIVDHADRHGFRDDYLRYLRKASNFQIKGARKKLLPNGAYRWNKGSEFIIKRDSKIISYGEN